MKILLRAVIGLVTFVTLLVVPTSPAQAATLDAHWLGALDDGNLYHTIRWANGYWQTGIGDVRAANNTSIKMYETAGAVVDGELHVLGVDGNGGLWHAIRRGDGSWTGFTGVFPFAGNPGRVEKVTAGSVGEMLHVVVTSDRGLFHTIRYAHGGWDQFYPVAPTHPSAEPPVEVALAVGPGNWAHLVVLGADYDVYHRRRHPIYGTWSPFVSLGVPNWEVVVDVAAAASLGGLHVALITDHPNVNVIQTKVFHQIRWEDGSWTGWGRVGGEPGVQLMQIGATAFYDNSAQFTLSGVYGEIYHTGRRSNGQWTGWGMIYNRSFGGTVALAGEW